MSKKANQASDLSYQHDSKKSALADYLEKSGLSLWLGKGHSNISSLPQIEVIIDSSEVDPALKGNQLHNCGCGSGSSCNASC